MNLGEKLIYIQTEIKNIVLQKFGQYGVDAHLGVLILDAVKSDLYRIALDSALTLAMTPEPTNVEKTTDVEE